MNDDVCQKLDILIKLQALTLTRDFESQKEKALFLHRSGLEPRIIASILGTSANSVSVMLSKARKSGEIE
jgi:transcriptional regulator